MLAHITNYESALVLNAGNSGQQREGMAERC